MYSMIIDSRSCVNIASIILNVVKILFLTRKIIRFYELVYVIVLNWFINSKNGKIIAKSYKNIEIG
jgi:hypothetical protein